MQDIRMSRLAGRFRPPLFYHAPSLVQHLGTVSTWGGGFHEAPDFDPDWKAAPASPDPAFALNSRQGRGILVEGKPSAATMS